PAPHRAAAVSPCGRLQGRKMPTLDFPSVRISDIALSNLPAVVIARLGGETDGEQLSQIAIEWLSAVDYLYTLAVMAAPDDPELAAALNNALAANELYEA